MVSSTTGYWLDLFTGTTWYEFLEADGEVSGFRQSRWTTVQKIRPGDKLLCYLTGISRFVGMLEVASPPFLDSTPIWKDEEFPCRVKTKILHALEPETAVPVLLLRDKLSVFRGLKNDRAWSGAFRGSPAAWKRADGQIVEEALEEAQRKPVHRPVDPAKLGRRPRPLATSLGPVTIPEPEPASASSSAVQAEESEHTEVQWLLLKLGSDMGLDVWVAQNDRSKAYKGTSFGSLPRIRTELKIPFDEATNRTVRLIDVLWLKRNAIVAAFEVESTTSIYSGLLRMADLISINPNLNIPLYLVAPDDRRNKVITEVNRATFSRLDPPLAQVCRLITFSTLRERLSRASEFTQYLRPEILEDLSESCDVEEP
jgi:hypothetical protein